MMSTIKPGSLVEMEKCDGGFRVGRKLLQNYNKINTTLWDGMLGSYIEEIKLETNTLGLRRLDMQAFFCGILVIYMVGLCPHTRILFS